MLILAIDPGPEQSAALLYDSDKRCVGQDYAGQMLNAEIRPLLPIGSILVIEHVSHYGSGMAVGASVFETCIAIGRFIQAWDDDDTVHLVKRQTIKTVLCGSARAKDANVRQALIDRFGGSREKAIGTKKAPGPLYGVSGHLWSALAVAVAWCELEAHKEAK